MSYDFVVIGGALRDFTFYVQEGKISQGNLIFPLDSKILVKKAYFTHGGGGNNVAVGLARFGLKVVLIARVGRDFSGQALIKNLINNKIVTEFVQTDKKAHTGVSLIVQKEGQGKTLFTFRGASERMSLVNLEPFNQTKWIYLASLTGSWPKLLNKIFSCAQRRKISVAWNPGAAQLEMGAKGLSRYLKHTQVLIINRHEAAQLLGLKMNTFNSKKIHYLIKKLSQFGPQTIVVTVGHRGAYVYNQGHIYYRPATGAKQKDATGAGDSFSSGFLAGLALFQDIKKALKLGILNSGANIQVIGAQDGLLDKKILSKI